MVVASPDALGWEGEWRQITGIKSESSLRMSCSPSNCLPGRTAFGDGTRGSCSSGSGPPTSWPNSSLAGTIVRGQASARSKALVPGAARSAHGEVADRGVVLHDEYGSGRGGHPAPRRSASGRRAGCAVPDCPAMVSRAASGSRQVPRAPRAGEGAGSVVLPDPVSYSRSARRHPRAA